MDTDRLPIQRQVRKLFDPLHKAEEIGIGKLVRETENLAVLECFPSGKGTCCIAGVCELQNIMGKALQAFMAELDKVTLADLLKKKPTLRQRLGLK